MIIYWSLPGVYQRDWTFWSVTLQPLGLDQSTISHMRGDIRSFHMMYSIMTWYKRLQSHSISHLISQIAHVYRVTDLDIVFMETGNGGIIMLFATTRWC